MKDYQKILTDFYRQHNPEKIGDVSNLLDKYRGSEEELLSSLYIKYGVSGSGKDYRQIITGIYRQHNPEKLSQVDSLLEKYRGSEEALIESLKKKYAGEPRTSAYGGQPPEAAGTITAPRPTKDYRAVITEIYRKHSPEKISLIDSLLEKYKGNEEALIDSLRRKYREAAPATTVQEPVIRPTEPPIAPSGAKDYRAIITEIFRKHDPTSVNVADAMLKKYQGQEEMLVQYLKRKYGHVEENSERENIVAQPATANAPAAASNFKEAEEPSAKPVDEPRYSPPQQPPTQHQRKPADAHRKLTPAEERAEYWRKVDERRRREKEMRQHGISQEIYLPVKETQERPQRDYSQSIKEKEEYREETGKNTLLKVIAIVAITLLLGGHAFFFINGAIRKAILTELGFIKAIGADKPPLMTEIEANATDTPENTSLAQGNQDSDRIEPGEITNDAGNFESAASGTLTPPCYIIVCGLYSSKDNAIREAERLKRNGLLAGYYFIPDYEPQGKNFYAAYVGSYKSRQSAEAELAEVRSYKRDAVVKHMGKDHGDNLVNTAGIIVSELPKTIGIGAGCSYSKTKYGNAIFDEDMMGNATMKLNNIIVILKVIPGTKVYKGDGFEVMKNIGTIGTGYESMEETGFLIIRNDKGSEQKVEVWGGCGA